MKLEQYAFVRLTKKAKETFLTESDTTENSWAFTRESLYIYLGEIPNMPGHCVVAGYDSGKIYAGYHPDEFEQLSIEET